jgi:hypothetical protein
MVKRSAPQRSPVGVLWVLLSFGLAVIGSAVLPRDARAVAACTAADIIAAEGACPDGPGPCWISEKYDLAGNTCSSLCRGGPNAGDPCAEPGDCPNGTCLVGCCELDFGERAVMITRTGELDFGFRRLIIRAGSFTVLPGGFVDGRGNGSGEAGSAGGMVEVLTTGDVEVQKEGTVIGRIDVSAKGLPGAIGITAGGAVTVGGWLLASELSATASGGSISITAGGDIVTAQASDLQAQGAADEFGGSVTLNADGRVELGDRVKLGGNFGSQVAITAAGDVTVLDQIDVSGSGALGEGGAVDIESGGHVTLGVILVSGANGGDGGSIFVQADGDIAVNENISADADGPDGFAESIEHRRCTHSRCGT